jgi:hypothetical protein
MTAGEWWALAAAIVAGVAALLDLASGRVTVPERPVIPLDRLARTLGHVAVGLIAVALLVAL